MLQPGQLSGRIVPWLPIVVVILADHSFNSSQAYGATKERRGVFVLRNGVNASYIGKSGFSNCLRLCQGFSRVAGNFFEKDLEGMRRKVICSQRKMLRAAVLMRSQRCEEEIGCEEEQGCEEE